VRSWLPRTFLALIAIAALAIGALGIAAPDASVAPMDIGINSAGARTEIRAVYGGLMLGIGIMLAWCAVAATRFGLTAVTCLLAPMAVARLYGLLADDSFAGPQWQFFTIEVVVVTLAFAILTVSKDRLT